MTLGSWNVLPSRMRFLTAAVATITSTAATRPESVGPWHQGLAEHRLQDQRKLNLHLLLLVRREGVDDAVDGLGRAGGMQRGQHQVARLGGSQGQGYRLQVSHLAHEDDVGVLAQHVLQGSGEGHGVGAQLPLRNQALLVLMDELDWVLDGHDVSLLTLVEVADHGGQRRRLAAAGGSRHQR